MASLLADESKKFPASGYEFGERGWLAGFLRDVLSTRLAVMPEPYDADDEESGRAWRTYHEAGFTIRSAKEWLDDFDELLRLLSDHAACTFPGAAGPPGSRLRSPAYTVPVRRSRGKPRRRAL
ncbi:hypothetical protein [Streptomyces sp. Tu6071]|uniref:hypothetical protein n=1 Tax=Streptomyces sp. Tu6071 TaxID=355249 RepID=UPI000312D551|nr:hypothetical protein [Streptomyces sp. Tu6071]